MNRSPSLTGSRRDPGGLCVAWRTLGTRCPLGRLVHVLTAWENQRVSCCRRREEAGRPRSYSASLTLWLLCVVALLRCALLTQSVTATTYEGERRGLRFRPHGQPVDGIRFTGCILTSRLGTLRGFCDRNWADALLREESVAFPPSSTVLDGPSCRGLVRLAVTVNRQDRETGACPALVAWRHPVASDYVARRRGRGDRLLLEKHQQPRNAEPPRWQLSSLPSRRPYPAEATARVGIRLGLPIDYTHYMSLLNRNCPGLHSLRVH